MENNSTLVNQFFSFLSERMYSENRLSDITWALCQVSKNFKFSFVFFFFKDVEKEDVRKIEIEREKQLDEGRPDFYLKIGNKEFLIENKINDKKHHFHQYLQTCKDPSYLGYITNYVIKDEDDIDDNGNVKKWKELKNEGFRVHTWEEFYDYLNNCIETNSNTLNEEERNLWVGYLEYIKKVCSIIKINRVMKIDGLYSLYSLMTILEKLCREGKGNNYSLSYYSDGTMSTSKCQRGISGINFELIYNTSPNEKIYGWIGVYYDREKPEIWIGFDKSNGWGIKYIEKLNNLKFLEGNTFETPVEEEALWFKMNNKTMDYLEQATIFDEQVRILKDFMDEVINYPEFLHNNVKTSV